MTHPWHNLPNAALIGRILADVHARPGAWRKSAAVTARLKISPEAFGKAKAASGHAAGAASRTEMWHAVGTASWLAAGPAGVAASWHVAGAVSALVAWDDCAYLLDTDAEQVKVLALLGHPSAMLLYPACYALSKSSTKSMTYST